MVMILTIMVCIVAHLTIGGFCSGKVTAIGTKKCGRTNHDPCGHSPLAFFSIFLWPVLLPIVGARMLGMKQIPNRDSRAETRRRREIEEANHRKNVAKIDAESVAMLEKANKIGDK